jgi:hypothetical protein
MADAAEEEEDDQNDEHYVSKYHRGKFLVLVLHIVFLFLIIPP